MKFKVEGVYRDFVSLEKQILNREVTIEIGQSSYKYTINNQTDLISLKEKIKGEVKVGGYSIDIENIKEITQLKMTEMQLGNIRLFPDDDESVYNQFKQFCKTNSVSLKLLNNEKNPITNSEPWANGGSLTKFQENFFMKWYNEETQDKDVGLSGLEESKELEL